MIGIIYRARNTQNGKVYIGQTIQFERRLSTHKKAAFDSRPPGTYFNRALQKYGWDSFEWSILCECASKLDLDQAEIFFISFYSQFRHGTYNVTGGGRGWKSTAILRRKLSNGQKRRDRSNHHPMLGKRHSEETKRKMSQTRIQKQIGHSEETKLHLSIIKTGKRLSEAHRAALSEGQKRRWSKTKELIAQ